jgi:hypothetical protein
MAKTKEYLLTNVDKILSKKPFTRGGIPTVMPSTWGSNVGELGAQLPKKNVVIVSQDTFLEELDTYSHAIQSPYILDDKQVLVSYEKADGTIGERTAYIPITRIALPLQRIIKIKQKVHLTGNDLVHTLASETQTDEDKGNFVIMKQFFTSKNMNVAIAENVDDQLTTGDTALLLYFDKNKKLDWKTYSWEDGYCLLPHYDEYENLILFGIYYASDEEDKSTTILDVYDETFFYRFKQEGSGWSPVKKEKHGFSEVPVCYKRGDVAWNDVQNLIEKLELHASLFAENVKYYGDPILFLKGETDVLPRRDDAGKGLKGLSPDADAKLLQAAESTNVTNLLDFLLKEIFRGSCTISFSPETVKTSGDLPGITVKLLFSAAVEKAIEQAKEWDGFIDRLMRLFIYAVGMETGKPAEFSRLKVFSKIEPWIPQNDTEIINNINTSKSAGTLSEETVAEEHLYAKADEHDRIKKEQDEKAQKEADLLKQQQSNNNSNAA